MNELTDTFFGDLDAIERHAYQDGNEILARIAGVALSAQSEVSEYEDELNKTLDSRDELKRILLNIDELITKTNWRTGKKAELRELGDAIYQELKAMP